MLTMRKLTAVGVAAALLGLSLTPVWASSEDDLESVQRQMREQLWVQRLRSTFMK